MEAAGQPAITERPLLIHSASRYFIQQLRARAHSDPAVFEALGVQKGNTNWHRPCTHRARGLAWDVATHQREDAKSS